MEWQWQVMHECDGDETWVLSIRRLVLVWVHVLVWVRVQVQVRVLMLELELVLVQATEPVMEPMMTVLVTELEKLVQR